MSPQDARAVALKVLANLAENSQDESIKLSAATQLAITTKTD
jgi:hypothetical protein